MVMPPVGAILTLAGTAAFHAAVASANASLRTIGATANASANVLGNAFDSIGRSAVDVTNAINTLSVVAVTALANAGTAAAVFGAQLEQNMTEATTTFNMTEQQVDELEKTVLGLARVWGINSRELAKSAGAFLRAGGEIKDLNNGAFERIIALQKLSGGELKLNDAISLVTGAMVTYNIHGDETERITSSIIAASQASAITFKDIYRSFSQTIGILPLYNIQIEEATAAIGMLGTAYIRNSDAGTSFRQFLVQLSDPTDKAIEAANRLGITLWDASKKPLPFIKVIENLEKGLKGLTITEDGFILDQQKANDLIDIFGTDAQRVAALLAKAGVAEYIKIREAQTRINTLDMGRKVMEPTVAQVKILITQLDTLATIAGSRVEPALRKLFSTINGLLGLLSNEQMSAIGDIFAAAFDVGSFTETNEKISRLFKGDIRDALLSFSGVVMRISGVINSQLIPSLLYLWESITGGQSPTSELRSRILSVGDTIIEVIKAISIVNVYIGELIRKFNEASKSSAVLQIILKGLTLLPIISIIALFIRLAAAILMVSAPVILLAAVVGALYFAFTHMEDIIAIFNSIASAIGGVVNFVLGAFGSIGQAIWDTISTAFSAVSEYLAVFLIFLGLWAARVAYLFIVQAATAVITWASVVLGSFNVVIPFIIGMLASLAKSFILTAVRAVVSAIAMVTAWVAASLGISASILVVMGVLLALAAVAYFIYKAWKENWLGVQGIVQGVLDWLGEQIANFINWLKGLPVIGTFIEGLAGTFNTVGASLNGLFKGIDETVAGAKKSVQDFINEASAGFPDVQAKIAGMLPDVEDLKKKLDELNKAGEDNAEKVKAQEEALAKLRAELEKELNTPSGSYPEKPDKPKKPKKEAEDRLSEAEKAKEMAKEINQILDGLPILTQELVDMLVQVGKEAPERLAPMLKAIIAQYNALETLAKIKLSILKIDQEILNIERTLALLTAYTTALEAKNKVIELSRSQELLDLDMERLRVRQAMWPLQDRIKEIDREINKLTRENLVLVQLRNEAEIALIPYKRQVLNVERQIEDAQRKNYDLAIDISQANLNILPQKQEIEKIDKRIADIGDRRLEAEQRLNKLMADREVTLIDRQLKKANADLDAAWQALDINKILSLEAQIAGLEDQKVGAENNVDSINEQIEDTEYYNEVARARLEIEKAIIEESLENAETIIQNLEHEQDLHEAIQDVVVLRLEKQKQALEDLMRPYERYIEDLNLEIETERTRNSLRVTNLKMEKQALEDLLEPLELRAEAIEREIQVINDEITIAQYSYNTQLNQYKLLSAIEESRRADLELTKAKFIEIYERLVAEFALALVASKAFTVDEAFQVAQRLGLWTDQIGKLHETAKAFDTIKISADEVTAAINSIPKEVTITVTTIHNDVFTTTGRTDGNNPGQIDSFSQGGVVPGPYGEPRLVIAHGGERFLGISSTIPTSIQAAMARPTTVYGDTRHTTVNYNVNANYSKTQSPASITMDLRSLASRARR